MLERQRASPKKIRISPNQPAFPETRTVQAMQQAEQGTLLGLMLSALLTNFGQCHSPLRASVPPGTHRAIALLALELSLRGLSGSAAEPLPATKRWGWGEGSIQWDGSTCSSPPLSLPRSSVQAATGACSWASLAQSRQVSSEGQFYSLALQGIECCSSLDRIYADCRWPEGGRCAFL